MSSTVSRISKAERLQASRAQFLAALGTRLATLRQAVFDLEAEPASDTVRRGLRRRLRAMAEAANVLSFAEMSESFAAAAARLEDGQRLDEECFAGLRQTLALIPGLVPDRASDASAEAQSPLLGWQLLGPATVLALGSTNQRVLLESALREFPQVRVCFASELSEAQTQAGTYEPDLVIIDARRADAALAVRSFEAYSCLVVEAESAAVDQWLRAGVSHVTIRGEDYPSAVLAGLRRLQRRPETLSERQLESATLEQVTSWIVEEVRGALLAPLDGESCRRRVPLDAGELRALLWSTIARLREMIARASSGAVRYENDAPEGAVLVTGTELLPPASPRSEGSAVRSVSAAEGEREADLCGRKVLIAEDEPATAWFLANLIRGAGAEVFEARDGLEAWKLAREHTPDLVVSDVMMPALDGFSLCRNLKRDVALSDVPVILLSWKEDLLQRVRELGVGADEYVAKETEGSTIVARCAAAMNARVRLERRMREEAVIYGRLDGMTPYSVLKLVCHVVDNAKVTFEDAAFQYEVRLGDGRILRARRRLHDASQERGGEGILASLLGIRAGRFTVERDTSPVQAEWHGSLDKVLRPHLERARRAMSRLQGVRLAQIARVELDWEAVEPYLDASPPIARRMLEQLRDHAPVELLRKVSATLLENVLVDVALRGGVKALIDEAGQDVLELVGNEPEPFDMMGEVLGPGADVSPAPGAPRVSQSSTPADAQRAAEFARAAADQALAASTEQGATQPTPGEPSAESGTAQGSRAPEVDERRAPSMPGSDEQQAGGVLGSGERQASSSPAADEPFPLPSSQASSHEEPGWTPMDLAEVVASGLQVTPARPARPLLKDVEAPRAFVRVQREPQTPSQLRGVNRGLTLTGLGRPDVAQAGAHAATWASEVEEDSMTQVTPPLASALPSESGEARPDAPGGLGDVGATRQEWPLLDEWEESTPAIVGVARPVAALEATGPAATSAGQTRPPMADALDASGAGVASRARVSEASRPGGATAESGEASPAVEPESERAAASAAAPESAGVRRHWSASWRKLASLRAPRGASRILLPAAVVLGAASGMYFLTGWVADQLNAGASVNASGPVTAVASSLKPVSSVLPEADIAPPQAASEGVSKPDERLVSFELPLPDELELGGDKGLLEISSGGRHKIYVGDVFVGRGPVRRVPLPPGEHEVRIQAEDREQRYQVTLTAGRRVRLSEPRSASN